MAALKTRATKASVTAFFGAIDDAERRRDCKTLATLMRRATGAAPRMWGPTIVGFGVRMQRYASGREVEWMRIGFSPRKPDLVLYGLGATGRHAALARRLGKHKTGKGCLYLRRLADVDLEVLGEMIERSVEESKTAKD